MCFRLEGSPVLFSGDTLFPGGPGNTKPDDADFDAIIQSIDRRLFAPLDPGTHVLVDDVEGLRLKVHRV